MPLRICFLEHVPFEGPGRIMEWVRAKGHRATRVALYEEHRLPEQEDFDWLIVMGGPMNVDEEATYPWLAAEKALIARALAADKRYLGVCLGAQLLARALRAPVIANRHREIGWHPVTLTQAGRTCLLFSGFPEVFTPFHWHGDTFALPEGSRNLAAGDACEHQAFSAGPRALGLQFHLDYDRQAVDLMLQHCHDDLLPCPSVAGPGEMLERPDLFQKAGELLFALLDNLEATDSLAESGRRIFGN